MVREQLLGFDFPSNAVGVTQEVEGSLVLGADGAIQADRSKLTIDLRSLVSDEDRRDNFIRRRVLETGFYSLAVFVPTEARGLPFPLPTQGESSFQLVGEMTIHGTTSELVWEVTMTFTEDQVVGEATAEFPFGKFDMSPPRVRLVLSVDDLIRLRISFRMSMTQGTGAAPG
jgi:polyisoprenoid-binding protein YceI